MSVCHQAGLSLAIARQCEQRWSGLAHVTHALKSTSMLMAYSLTHLPFHALL